MFLAYCKQQIDNLEIENIKFTNKKQEFKDKILVLERAKKGNEWYIIRNTTLLFHSSWLKTLTEVNERIFVAYIQVGFCSTYRICNIEDNNDIFDIEFNEQINRIKKLNLNDNYGQRDIERIIDAGNNFKTKIIPIVECQDCHKKTLIIYLNENKICIECSRKNIIICDKCHNEKYKNNIKEINFQNKNKKVCLNCFYELKRCHECNKYFDKNKIFLIEDKAFCPDCIKKQKFIICERCGHGFFEKSSLIKKYENSYICNPCFLYSKIYPSKKYESNKINEYNYKPNPIFYGKKESDNLFFGVELEITTPHKYRDKLSEYISFNFNQEKPFLYLKFDRSIGNEGTAGFEIVTHPFNYQWLNSKNGIEKIEQLFNIKSFGCESFYTNTCGMHVHLSKKAFTNIHLYKFLKMIYEQKDFSIIISERDDMQKVDTYMNFEPIKPLKILAQERINGKDNNSRHKAVNLSCENTVEVRIFKGTLEIEKFLKNIQYCKSLFHYTEEESFKNLNLDNYLKYIQNNKKTFLNLYTFLQSKKVI
jgi:hypothetical protein